jgi:hypothetical protein
MTRYWNPLNLLNLKKMSEPSVKKIRKINKLLYRQVYGNFLTTHYYPFKGLKVISYPGLNE